jgi:hypothetical protein
MKNNTKITLFFHTTPFYCLIVILFLSNKIEAQSGHQIFDTSKIHEIRVTFDDPAFWDTLTAHYNNSLPPFPGADPIGTNTPIPARVIIDGTLIDSVGVSQKGFFSNWATNGKKKPLKLDFNEFITNGSYDNLKSIHLQNGFKDPSLMRDMLSYRILRDFGVAAPRSAYAKVYLNNTYWGLYTAVESVNKTFLKEQFGNNDGNLYKALATTMEYKGDDPTLYKEDFELKTNESENDWSRLIKLLKMIKETPDSVFSDSLRHYMDLESYFRTIAVDIAILNWDSHLDHGRNFYLYDNPNDGKFYWIPWDYNLSFADPMFYGPQYNLTIDLLRSLPEYDKILPKRVFNNSSLTAMYLDYACELQQKTFTITHLYPIIDYNKTLIAPPLEEDVNKFYPNIDHFYQSLEGGFSYTYIDTLFMIDTFFTQEVQEQFAGLKNILNERRDTLLGQLLDRLGSNCAEIMVNTHNPPPNKALEVWPNPASDMFYLKAQEAGVLRVFDVSGHLVVDQLVMPELDYSSVSISHLSAGFYWITYHTEKGQQTIKLIKGR